MFGDIIQPTHLLLILLVALLVLGPKRLPEVGRGLGKGIRDFRSSLAGVEDHTSVPFEDERASRADPVATSVRATVPHAVLSEAESGD
jgi:sec-independent protein translocase protein TatA